MGDSREYLGNVMALAGERAGGKGRRVSVRSQEDAATAALKSRGALAGNVEEALVQGLDPQDTTAWEQMTVRLAEVVKVSAAMTRDFDHYKNFAVLDEGITYVPKGTKIKTAGSIWLVTNPMNVAAGRGVGLMEHCNAVWRHLDWYGNILKEPLCFASDQSRANSGDPQELTRIAKGYYLAKCQYNDQTAQLDTNSRMVLGSGAYVITGYGDFAREFTDDPGSVRMLTFTLRYEEPNREMDDMTNGIAGGLTFSWEILLNGRPVMAAGSTGQCSATSHRCGSQVFPEDMRHPFDYLWSSTDEEVAKVDAFGKVTAVGEGECEILCSLAQNPAIWSAFPVTVETGAGVRVEFTDTPPAFLGVYQETAFSAACYRDGEETGEEVTWTFTGADKDAYRAETEGNTVKIVCWKGSVAPLTVTASWGDAKASAEIRLEGL